MKVSFLAPSVEVEFTEFDFGTGILQTLQNVRNQVTHIFKPSTVSQYFVNDRERVIIGFDSNNFRHLPNFTNKAKNLTLIKFLFFYRSST